MYRLLKSDNEAEPLLASSRGDVIAEACANEQLLLMGWTRKCEESRQRQKEPRNDDVIEAQKQTTRRHNAVNDDVSMQQLQQEFSVRGSSPRSCTQSDGSMQFSPHLSPTSSSEYLALSKLRGGVSAGGIGGAGGEREETAIVPSAFKVVTPGSSQPNTRPSSRGTQ